MRLMGSAQAGKFVPVVKLRSSKKLRTQAIASTGKKKSHAHSHRKASMRATRGRNSGGRWHVPARAECTNERTRAALSRAKDECSRARGRIAQTACRAARAVARWSALRCGSIVRSVHLLRVPLEQLEQK